MLQIYNFYKKNIAIYEISHLFELLVVLRNYTVERKNEMAGFVAVLAALTRKFMPIFSY